jgi:hypothetical protein
MKELNPIVNIEEKEFIQIFKLNDLSPSAKKNAIENYRDLFHKYGYEIRDSLRYFFSEMLKEHGLPDEDIRWSLSYSQGDGMAFYGNIEFEKLLSAHPELKESLPNCMKLLEIYNYQRLTRDKDTPVRTIEHLCYMSIFKSNHFYDHERSMGLSIDVYESDIECYLDELNEQIKGSFMPDDEVNLTDWEFKHVEGNKWTIENETHVWEVTIATIDGDEIAQYEDEGTNIPDSVKKVFNEKTNTKSFHRYYPGIYLSASMIEKEIMEFEKVLLKMFVNISSELESGGYKIYESMDSDEAMTERIMELDIRFDIAGDIIPTKC